VTSRASTMTGRHNDPRRTVLLLQDLEFGGTQRHAVQLLRLLDRERLAPELWVLRGGDEMGPLAEATAAPLRRFSSSPRWVTPLVLARLLRALQRAPPEILYLMTGIPNIWGRLFGSAVGVPALVTSWRSERERQCEHLLWPLSRRLLCNAEALRSKVLAYGVPSSRVVVVPNGVDCSTFRPSPGLRSQNPEILFLGRLVSVKSPFTLLDAFEIVQRALPSAQLRIVGDGPLLPAVRARAASGRLRVELQPGVREVAPLLARAWVLALSSRSEGSPNVVLEAMACGLPVVASRVGGVPALVRDGETGRLVPAGDPQVLGATLVSLLRDSTERERMATRARAIAVREHDERTMVERIGEVLLEAADEAARSGPIGLGALWRRSAAVAEASA
jgi:glycosyltransferase involved in cell wall biosynthesis